VTRQDAPTDFQDYYEVLQLSPNADTETIDRVYRVLARRYHPDNQETGDGERFARVVAAHGVLSDPTRRTAYDAAYENNRAVLKVFDEDATPDGYEGDRRIFDGILSLLYVARRRDAHRGGMGMVQLEKMLACPAQHLEFHLWYLREKGWIQRLDNGTLAISAAGVDRVMNEGNHFLRPDRLLTEKAGHASEGSQSAEQ
jgi:curved DNA-binding protein CbpA